MKDPSKSVTTCEEYFVLVVEAHILQAAMTLFGMKSLEDTPNEKYFPAEFVQLNLQQQHCIFAGAISKLLSQYVDLNVTFSQSVCSGAENQIDTINEYAMEVISLGLLLLEFNDSVREGDGDRILRCWRYFLLLFKASNKTNYAIEAFTLLAQEKYLLSPRMAMQLKWSRTVNVHGRSSKNVSCDLHMEHLNRLCKNLISGLGANITEQSIERVGKCIGSVQTILLQFDAVNKIKEESGRHTSHSTDIDMKNLLKQLQQSSVFACKPGRAHRSFPKFTTNLMKKMSKEKLLHWMHEQMQKLLMYH